MKKTFITLALLAVLGTLAVSCQKENIIDETSIVEENAKIYTVSYSVDGVNHQITLIGDEAWHDFLNRMFALVEEGHKVSFRNEERASRVASSKESVTYTTTNREEAYTWAEKMTNEGYTVIVSFDKKTGVYTCDAIK
ncbi:MAG: hypothetical protein IJK07_07550 [Bacteroidales bacterium]|nr:hypothetical protein [Bacteroidales bacterium]